MYIRRVLGDFEDVVQITGESCFFFVRSERQWTFHMPEILQPKYQLWAFRLGGGCRL
jgi:hypothetical protein